jgi:arylformamidase
MISLNGESALVNTWLEDEYTTRVMVPGFEAIRDGWTVDAAEFRAGHSQADFNVKYGPSERQVLDIFWPGKERNGPLAMFIHGGYWQALNKDWFSHVAAGFNAHGIALALPSYDLCPHVSLTVLVEQVRQAAAYLLRLHGRDIYATGHSAGGHLTAMLLATDWAARQVPGKISGGYAISGVFDLVPLTGTSVNDALQLSIEQARALSPVLAPRPPGLLRAFVGEREGAEFTRQSSSIAAAWGGDWGVIPNADHFTVVNTLADRDSMVMQTIARDILSPGNGG